MESISHGLSKFVKSPLTIFFRSDDEAEMEDEVADFRFSDSD
jgi:hypothetical protein